MIDPQRSAIMRSVKSKDTVPEIQVRRFIHSLGYRFRLHRKDLPGTPDLAFPRLKCAVFVHGCFWHGHSCSRGARVPKTNTKYWRSKITRNIARDTQNRRDLRALGWNLLVVWECHLKSKLDSTQRRIALFLERASSPGTKPKLGSVPKCPGSRF